MLSKVLANTLEKLAHIKETGSRTNPTAKESKHGKTVASTKAITKEAKSKGKASTFGPTNHLTTAAGCQEKSMVMAHIVMSTAESTMEVS